MWSAFNCYVLAIAIFISAFRDQTAKSVFRNIKLLLLEILGTIAMYSPVLIHYIRTGVNTKAAAYTRSCRSGGALWNETDQSAYAESKSQNTETGRYK